MSKNNEWFIIDDLEKFVESSRVLIFDSFGKNDSTNIDDLSIMLNDLPKDEIEELNSVLTQEECLVMAKPFMKLEKNKRTQEIRYIISSKKYMEMLESFNSRMVSNLLNNLVNRGILDSAYDSDSDDFIFWVKDEDDQKQKETPETD
jgi:Mg/Co/Ni transporter MgtE